MSKIKRSQYIANLLRWVADQVEASPNIADEIIDVLLEGVNYTLPLLPKSDSRTPKAKVLSKNKQRETPKVKSTSHSFDAFDIFFKDGRNALRLKLNQLGIEQLKKIVAHEGFDPARLTPKWKNKERLVKLIIDRVEARSKKGDVFMKH